MILLLYPAFLIDPLAVWQKGGRFLTQKLSDSFFALSVHASLSPSLPCLYFAPPEEIKSVSSKSKNLFFVI